METLEIKNFEMIIHWLTEGGEKPEVTDEFIYELTEKIRLKNIQKRREKRSESIPKILTIKGLMKEIANENKEEVVVKNTQNKTLEIIKVFTAKEKEEVILNEEGYKEKGLDAADIAKTIMQCANNFDMNLSNSKVLTILYDLYGEWLAIRNERLTADRPQAWKFGPVFPRAYNKLKKDLDFAEKHALIRKSEPALYAIIADMVSRLNDKPSWADTNTHTAKGTPWYRTFNETDKGVKVIADKCISDWFRKRTLMH